MIRDDALLRSVERLCDLEVEYDMTIRVLSVLVEQLQQQTRGSEIRVAQSSVDNQPDLSAWRNDDGSVSLRASR
jgi:hypothetical protein